MAGALVLGGILRRLWRRGREKLPFLQITVGGLWLVAWAAIDAYALLTGRVFGPFSEWTTAAVVAGVGQILLGSLAYLVPVLLGPPLSQRMAVFGSRRGLPLVAANAGGIALVAGLPGLAVAGFALWSADFAWRLGRQRGLAVEA